MTAQAPDSVTQHFIDNVYEPRDPQLAWCRAHDEADAKKDAEREAAIALLASGMRHLGDDPDRSTFADHRGWRNEVAAFLADRAPTIAAIQRKDEALRQAREVLEAYNEPDSHDGECEMQGGRCLALGRAIFARHTARRAAIAAIDEVLK